MACEECDHISEIAEKREADLTDKVNEQADRIKELEKALDDVQAAIDEMHEDASKIIGKMI